MDFLEIEKELNAKNLLEYNKITKGLGHLNIDKKQILDIAEIVLLNQKESRLKFLFLLKNIYKQKLAELEPINNEYINFYKNYYRQLKDYTPFIIYKKILDKPNIIIDDELQKITAYQKLKHNDPSHYFDLLDIFTIYQYGKQNEKFKQLLNFIIELDNYYNKQKDFKFISAKQFKNIFDTKKDYYNYYIFLISTQILEKYYIYFYNNINPTNKIEFYNFNLQTYTEQFYKLLNIIFTKLNIEINKKIIIETESKKQLKELLTEPTFLMVSPLKKGIDNTSYQIINISEHYNNNSIEDVKKIAKDSIKHPNIKKEIKELRENTDFIGTDEQATDIIINGNGEISYLQQLGLSFTQNKATKKYYFKAQTAFISNEALIDYKNLYAKCGYKSILLMNYILSEAIKICYEKKINNFTHTQRIIIDPYIFDNIRGMENKNISETIQEIDDCLKVLTTEIFTINYTIDENQHFTITPNKITNNKKYKDFDNNTKQEIIDFITGKHNFTIVSNYDPIKNNRNNKTIFSIQLDDTARGFVKAIYADNKFIQDKAPIVKEIAGNQYKTRRANYFKQTFLEQMKLDGRKETKKLLKENKWTEYPFSITYGKLKEKLTEATLINNEVNKKKSYYEKIAKPIYETLEYLQESKIINFDDKGAFNKYAENRKINPTTQKRLLEKSKIDIILLNHC